MAVSYAMRNLPKVSAAMRDKILATAKELGYHPDPALSALVAHRSNISRSQVAAPLAWISNSPAKDDWLKTENFARSYYLAACDRAAEHGYRIERFWLGDVGMTPARMSSILYSRGIEGLLIAPQRKVRARLNMEWEKFTSVTFGHTLAHPQLHMVTTHHSSLTVNAVRRIRSLGYRRVGLFLNPMHDLRVAHNYFGPFLAEQYLFEPKNRIPPFYETNFSWPKLAPWIRKWKPDCLLVSDIHAAKILRAEGFRMPKDIGLVTLEGYVDSEVAGMDHNFSAVGVAAVDLLIGLIHRAERGIPTIRRSVFVEGSWVEGKTLCRQNVPTRPARRTGRV